MLKINQVFYKTLIEPLKQMVSRAGFVWGLLEQIVKSNPSDFSLWGGRVFF